MIFYIYVFYYYYIYFFFQINFVGLNINMFFIDNFLLFELFNHKTINLNNLFFFYNLIFFNVEICYFIVKFKKIDYFLFCLYSFFFILFFSKFFFKFLKKILKKIINFLYDVFFMYQYYKFSNYNFLYQYWYRFARNKKNTYLAIRFRLVYLTKKIINRDIFNFSDIHKDDIQEFFILKRKKFFDNYLRPKKVSKFVPLLKFRHKFYSNKRRKMVFKGLLFFYFKDYENRINNKEQQQKTLRIYEGLYGTFIYQELLKKEDQKQAKFVRMKLHRD